jgi:DNA-damage-inducible protein J
MYIKKVLTDRRIPFEISNDPFYSESNQEWVSESIAEAKAGKLKKHDLIEV